MRGSCGRAGSPLFGVMRKKAGPFTCGHGPGGGTHQDKAGFSPVIWEMSTKTRKPLSISLMDLISKRIRVMGSQQNHREFLFEALDLAARGKVKVMTEIYPLAEIGKAYDRVEQGKVRFRAVITP